MSGRRSPAKAAAEIAALRVALGEDKWRLRRLAELGIAQAKISHDLRNLMTSALMVADRLQASADPKVGQAGRTLVRSIEEAAALIAMTQNFAAEGAPLLAPARFPLAALIDEVAEALRAEHGHLAIENAAPDHLHLEADRAQFGRVIGHLLRTAAKAQARRLVVHAEQQTLTVDIVLTDDGLPFRDGASAAAFQPFSGTYRHGSTGLGLVIARDVIEAHGGTITIRAGAADGRTCIVVSLPQAG